MKFFLFLVALTPITASASADPSQNVFREEANAFCLVHSIDYWKETGQLEALHTLDPTQRQIRLTKKIQSAITSEEMVRVIVAAGTMGSNAKAVAAEVDPGAAAFMVGLGGAGAGGVGSGYLEIIADDQAQAFAGAEGTHWSGRFGR